MICVGLAMLENISRFINNKHVLSVYAHSRLSRVTSSLFVAVNFVELI